MNVRFGFLFLSTKYDFTDRILGILKALKNLTAQMKGANEPIMILETMNVKGIKVNEKNMKEKTRLYNVT